MATRTKANSLNTYINTLWATLYQITVSRANKMLPKMREQGHQFDTYAYSADPDSKAHGANMGPTWVLSAPGGPHAGPMNLAIRGNS